MGKNSPERRKGAGGNKEREATVGRKGHAAQQGDPGAHRCILCHEPTADQPATYVKCNVGCSFLVHDRCDHREMENIIKGICARKRAEVLTAHRDKWCWKCSEGKDPTFADCFTAGNRKPYPQRPAEGLRGEPGEWLGGDERGGERKGEGHRGGDGTTSAPVVVADSGSALMAGTEGSGRFAGSLGPSSAAAGAEQKQPPVPSQPALPRQQQLQQQHAAQALQSRGGYGPKKCISKELVAHRQPRGPARL
eukprot:TRINITY_DN6651_c2_g1_i1.p1 TRINITY_DN6651_c2_g1~~TRINITY_DN6651_c2_g1_i1.p1  ORF type:complete len:276 (+),score=66.49 TRINITY_DN6651_c2_g1_i1:80-829(+)